MAHRVFGNFKANAHIHCNTFNDVISLTSRRFQWRHHPYVTELPVSFMQNQLQKTLTTNTCKTNPNECKASLFGRLLLCAIRAGNESDLATLQLPQHTRGN